MMVKNITNKNDKRSQKGRSMVEMLGVLSIIGVLSVGGISAYSTAMEKHKANELMAATMQEAVLISAQLATGNTNPTLSGINNSLFTSASTVANSDNFKIALNAVDEDVCTKMKSMLGVSSMVHAISDNCTEMTFHKNLTPKAVTQSGGNNSGTGDSNNNSCPSNYQSEKCSPGYIESDTTEINNGTICYLCEKSELRIACETAGDHWDSSEAAIAIDQGDETGACCGDYPPDETWYQNSCCGSSSVVYWGDPKACCEMNGYGIWDGSSCVYGGGSGN